MLIRSVDQLRERYGAPVTRAVQKEIHALDRHCRDFIALSPFVVLATSDEAFDLDASPRGGAPGFVKVTEDGQLLLPDSPGNNRLDSLQNIVRTGRVGMLFMIPGFDETLRINGEARLSTADEDLAACADARRTPKVVVRVSVKSAYLHCAKAFMRSKLWAESSKVDRDRMPTLGKMIADQSGSEAVPETREEMERRFAADL